MRDTIGGTVSLVIIPLWRITEKREYQFSKEGELLQVYYSIADIKRTGVNKSSIAENDYNTAGGCKWEFAE